jgi:hypothetical protein
MYKARRSIIVNWLVPAIQPPLCSFVKVILGYRILDPHNGGWQEFCLLGYNALRSSESRDISEGHLTSVFNVPLLTTSFILDDSCNYFPALNMEEIYPYEMLVDFYRTKWQYIP